MKYTALFPSMTLHAAGCRDIKKDRMNDASQFSFEAPSLDAALDEVIDDELVSMGYTHDHVIVKPCARAGDGGGR